MSSAQPRQNLRSTSIKRILQEHKELLQDPPEDFIAQPLENDLFEWHVTMRGATGSDYEGGIYHLRVLLPPTYPLAPPDIQILTPSGRFEVNKKICIDGITSFHTGSWRPIWGIRTAVVGLGGFWNQNGKEAVSGYGGLDLPSLDKKRLAKTSPSYVCSTCQKSNEQIMREHEAVASQKVAESFKVKEDDVFKPDETEKSGAEGNAEVQHTADDKLAVSKGPDTIVQSASMPSDSAAGFQIAQPNDNIVPVLNIFQTVLLTSWLSSSWLPAPIRLVVHLAQLCFLPTPVLQAKSLPIEINPLLLVDTLLWVLMSAILVLTWGMFSNWYWKGGRFGSGLKKGTAVAAGAAKNLAKHGHAAAQPQVLPRAGNPNLMQNGRNGARANPTLNPDLPNQGIQQQQEGPEARARHGGAEGHHGRPDPAFQQRTGMTGEEGVRLAAAAGRAEL